MTTILSHYIDPQLRSWELRELAKEKIREALELAESAMPSGTPGGVDNDDWVKLINEARDCWADPVVYPPPDEDWVPPEG